jgi:hypothetical protein
MMNNEDQLSALLREMPEQWGRDITDDGFTAGVVSQVVRRRRQRSAAVAVAGSIGGTVASSQLAGLANSEPLVQVAVAVLEPLQGIATPQFLMALVMAAVAGCVAWVLPNRV